MSETLCANATQVESAVPKVDTFPSDSTEQLLATNAEGPAHVTVTIDGRHVGVPATASILDAAASAGVHIPTLCHLRGVSEAGACRTCVVEVEGAEALVSSCNTQVADGMVVRTNSPRVRLARRVNVEFLLSAHDTTCTSCVRSGTCLLQEMANDLGIAEHPYQRHLETQPWPQGFPLIRSTEKCIHCLRCIAICERVQGCGVWGITNRASHTMVGVSGGRPIGQADCTLCGQCLVHCPTGALRERDDTWRVLDALADPHKVVVAQVAPAARTSWGEGLGIPRAEATCGRLVAALRAFGFDHVFDVSFGADLTVMEEAAELVERMHHPELGPLPLLTSCCPAWVRYAKAHYPQLTAHHATAKSPHRMLGTVVRHRWAEEAGVDPRDVFVVSIMPCLAKKAEMGAGEGGLPDVDASLTVRELCRLLRADHLDPLLLEESPFDQPMGDASGAAYAFGVSEGVLTATLRTARHLAEVGASSGAALFAGSGKHRMRPSSAPGEVGHSSPVRRCAGGDARGEVAGAPADAQLLVRLHQRGTWQEGTCVVGGVELRVAVASGLGPARELLDALQSGEVSYDFIEVMACPGGCVGGGGQPIHEGRVCGDDQPGFSLSSGPTPICTGGVAGNTYFVPDDYAVTQARAAVLRSLDVAPTIHAAHDNPTIQHLYATGLPTQLLHTDHFA